MSPKTGAGVVKRRLWIDIVLLTICSVIFVSLLGLGNWQVRRLFWKRDLIETVEARAFGEPVTAPTGAVTQEDYAYLRVQTRGEYRHELSQKVKALTDLGAGWWVLTPLQTDTKIIWVNRGFIPAGLAREAWAEPVGVQAITGLLRVTEPDGTVLEKNNLETGRWVSRDVQALSRTTGLDDVEEYFIDAEHSGAVTAYPRGGLTHIAFRNSHLSYALTWYTMAALFFAAMVYVIWDRLNGRSAEDV